MDALPQGFFLLSIRVFVPFCGKRSMASTLSIQVEGEWAVLMDGHWEAAQPEEL